MEIKSKRDIKAYMNTLSPANLKRDLDMRLYLKNQGIQKPKQR